MGARPSGIGQIRRFTADFAGITLESGGTAEEPLAAGGDFGTEKLKPPAARDGALASHRVDFSWRSETVARVAVPDLMCPGEDFHRVGDLLDGAGGPTQGDSCSDLFGGPT